MVTRISRYFLVLLLLLPLLVSACEKKTDILIGGPDKLLVAEVPPGKIFLEFFNYVDSMVVTELVFYAERTGSPKAGFILVENKHDIGSFWVLADEEKYGESLRSLKRGQTYKICGTITAIPWGDREKAQVAILVE